MSDSVSDGRGLGFKTTDTSAVTMDFQANVSADSETNVVTLFVLDTGLITFNATFLFDTSMIASELVVLLLTTKLKRYYLMRSSTA